MTTKEHPNAHLLRAIADGKTILDARGDRIATGYALHLIIQCCANNLTVAPDTIVVNGIEVPAPYRGPMEHEQMYWVADPSHRKYALCVCWGGNSTGRMFMERGLIHLDEQAAAAHGRAMAAASMQEGGAA